MNYPHAEPDTLVVVQMLGPSIGEVYSVKSEKVFQTDVEQVADSPFSDLERIVDTLPDYWFRRGDMVTFTGDSDPMVVLRDMSFTRTVVVRDIAEREFTLPHDKLTLIGRIPTKTPSVYKDPESGSNFFVLEVDYDRWSVTVFDNDHDEVVGFLLDGFAALNLELHYY